MEQTTITWEDLIGNPEEERQEEQNQEVTFDLEVAEEESAEETPPKEVEKAPVELPKENEFDQKVKSLIDSKDWDANYLVEIDGKEVPISELEDIDEDTFKAIEKAIDEDKDKEFKESYVEVKGLTETQKALINIIKEGNLEKAKELFEQPEQLQEPYAGYDSKNDTHNEHVLYHYYKTTQNFSDKKIKSLIELAKEELTLDSEAEDIVNRARIEHKQTLIQKEREIKEAKIAEEEGRKVYKKDLSANYKKDYNFPDTLVKKLVDATTVPDKDGELPVDKVYEQLMKDPKEAAEVALFLLNRQEYNNRVKAPVKAQEQLNMYKKIKVVKDTAPKALKQKEEVEGTDIFSNISF